MLSSLVSNKLEKWPETFESVQNTKDICKNPKYREIYRKSIENPEQFWSEVGTLLTWTKPWKKVMDNSNEPFTKWFVGGELNACYNALDRHVHGGRGRKVALIYDSPLIQAAQKVTYDELLDKVSRMAGALSKFGVRKGDRVVIYMPVIPETVIAMLAVARLGAVHSVVFGGFAASELAIRIEHATPKIIIAANCGIEPGKVINYKKILSDALKSSSFKPSRCIIFERRNIEKATLDRNTDTLWDEVLDSSGPHPCVSVEANDPLYILYTSGTTDNPKAVQRSVGGGLASVAWSIKHTYGMENDDVWWATSDFGWVLGHSFMCYGPLVNCLTSVLYEGKPVRTPDAGQYFRIIEKYRVNAMFTVPTALRVIKREDPHSLIGKQYDTSSMRNMFLGGEHLDYETRIWAKNAFGIPILNQWWQTETGYSITATCVGFDQDLRPPKLTVGLPFPGYDVRVLKKTGFEAKPNEIGDIVVKLPLPPGTLSTLYKAHSKFCQTYYRKHPGFYYTMDAGYIDENGYVYITARVDDVINIAGHRISTAAIEDVVMSHPDVTDAAVVGVSDPIKGQVPLCLFITRQSDMDKNDNNIGKELITKVRGSIGPVADFHLFVSIKDLPHTRSGKICRKLISKFADDQLFEIPVTVENPSSFVDLANALKKVGYALKIPPTLGIL
ncbi:acyl-CoA synthetase short-chain family member 3, mitochondrial-like [Photinus pyralis]|uniref:acyl-CoA synthetase short-chain family member 3, mitochondrial-like n=1 Tax=Photinus pyralis TaxID=7054 RepID=UPI0012677213|nr:acyl-CoA synthetase short-chain family member 3, mitochondrial-like [Photinus pyralis]